MKPIESCNDCVIRFANVNGSGSASANNLFAKAIFRMGVPVSPKNIFPSNIQGLPTWYEVRISERGFLGRRGDTDMIVAMNGQTMLKDYTELLAGGYFVYDSSRKLPEEYDRDDVVVIGIPLTLLCNEAFENPRMRGLLKNIIYVGALAYLLDMDFEVLTGSVEKQYQKKTKLIEPNLKALQLGYDYVRKEYSTTCKLTVKKANQVGDSIVIDGNTATALGALYAGATVVGWYPITPSTSIIESFGRYADRYRREKESGEIKAAIVQAEDELAALGIVIGACWNGARAFTATSGPGISLMSEFLGLAYFAEIPAVVINVQRVGPSTGMPTRTQQSDLLACGYASHGDTRHVLLFPANPKECFEMTADAFDLAERLQTPVIVMSDLDLGMNDHMTSPLTWDDERIYDRGKVLGRQQLDDLQEQWGRYLDVDGDGICYRTYPGVHPDKGAYFVRGTSHDEYSKYTEESAAYEKNMQRLDRKWESAKQFIPQPESVLNGKAGSIGIICYGTTIDPVVETALLLQEKEGISLNVLCLKGFPFHQEVVEFVEQHEKILVVEQNRDGQMRTLLINELQVVADKLISVLNYDGLPIAARILYTMIREIVSQPLPEQGGVA